jgi:two-component system response regulator WspF
VNVAIVNDSRMATEVLRRVLTKSGEFKLLWTAASGDEALERARAARPDIVLMDLIMPGMDGAETTRRMMRQTPCVILVVTATTVGNRDMVFEAMGHGALDAVNTPTMGSKDEVQGADALLRKLQTVARFVSVGRGPAAPAAATPQAAAPHGDRSRLSIVAIGASTGGPQALIEVLSHLPAQFPAVVLISQHVDQQFAPGLAAWLQNHTPLPVKLGTPHQPLAAGTIVLSGTNDHLIYEPGGFANYTEEPRDTTYRPSVDVLFKSLALPHPAPRVGVLLTGMGRDGAEGLLALRRSGALTLAQDEATSVVYGMPKAAAELKAACEILPLRAIGPKICDHILRTQKSARTEMQGASS